MEESERDSPAGRGVRIDGMRTGIMPPVPFSTAGTGRTQRGAIHAGAEVPAALIAFNGKAL